MITSKEILKKIKRVKAVEDVFRQIAEERQYLVSSFNVAKFHSEVEHVLNKKISRQYVEWWLSGYRKRKKL